MVPHLRYRRRQGQPPRGKFRGAFRRRGRNGITAVEVLFLLFIAIVMVAFFVVWLNHQRNESRALRCEDRQVQIAFALLAYDLVNDRLPGWAEPPPKEARRIGPQSWVVTSMPYLGRRPTPSELNRDEPFDPLQLGPHAKTYDDYLREGNAEALGSRRFIADLICPEDPRLAQARTERAPLLGYVVNGGRPDAVGDENGPPDKLANGVFLNRVVDRSQTSSRQFVEDHDGAAHTLLLTENVDAGKWTDLVEATITFLWSLPDAAEKDTVFAMNDRAGLGDGTIRFARPSSRHGKGINTVNVDGGSRFIEDGIDPLLFKRLMTSDESNADLPTLGPPNDASTDVSTEIK